MKRMLISLFVLVVVTPALAETHGDAKGGAGGKTSTVSEAGKTPHQVSEGVQPWSPERMKVVGEMFPELAKDDMKYLTKRYWKAIPDALEKAEKGDKGPIANIVAELFRTVDNEGLNNALAVAEKKLAEPDPSKRDPQIIAFSDFIKKSAPIKLGQKGDGKDKDYEEKFKEKNAEQEKIVAKIDEAAKKGANGDKESKEFVKNNVAADAVVGWAAKNIGRAGEFVKNIMSSMTFDAVKGGKILDLVGLKGETQRMWLGDTPAAVSKALDKFFAARGSFPVSVAAGWHDAPQTEWFVDAAGNVTKGKPPGAEAPAPRGLAKGGGGAGAGQGKGGGGTDAGQGKGGDGAGAGQAKALNAGTVIAQRCNGCHGEGKQMGAFSPGGAAARVKNNTMPPGGGLSQAEKDALLKQFGG